MATFEWTGGAVEVPVGCYVGSDGVLHATEKADKVGTPLSTVDGDSVSSWGLGSSTPWEAWQRRRDWHHHVLLIDAFDRTRPP